MNRRDFHFAGEHSSSTSERIQRRIRRWVERIRKPFLEKLGARVGHV